MDVIETPTTDETQATVLVMEDDADMRTYLRSIFEPAFAVIEAADGYAALALARERVPDFILTDYMTPGLDGIGFCRALKADDTTSHIPVIMVTARTSDADYLAGLEVGIDDYITKPFSSRVLRLKVENILANRRAMWEHLRAREGVASAAATPTDRFYDRLYDEIEAHLGDEDFNTEALAKAMNMSRSQLYRKVLAVLGRPAGDLIRETRMTRARARLLATDEQVSTIAYALGFKSVSHFTKSFTAHAGVSPSRFRRQRQGVD